MSCVFLDPLPIVIGARVWPGAGVIVVPGVALGANTVLDFRRHVVHMPRPATSAA